MSARHGGEVAVALILDALVGEPPESLHPTVWMGRVISAFEERAVELRGRLSRRLAGIVLAAALPTVVYLSVRSVLALAPRPIRRVLGTALISTSLSMRGLAAAAGAVERELRRGDVERARARVGEMVGRDTERLSETEVARAAVESVAENASDGVVAPMLYGLLFGAPGALTYKTINTLDSMVGYRTGPYRELGWASARLDDLANVVPARATVLAAGIVSGRPGRALGAAWRYGPLAASPNAGWAEAAFAGVLGLRLGGANVYGGVLRDGPVLGDGRSPEPEDIRRAVRVMSGCCLLIAAGAILLGTSRRG